MCALRRFRSACANTEADQNPHWAHILERQKFLHVDNEDSDQTARIRRLSWVFVGYENAPIQIHWEFLPTKNENFHMKNSGSFQISAQDMDCGYSLEPPRRGGYNECPQSMF